MCNWNGTHRVHSLALRSFWTKIPSLTEHATFMDHWYYGTYNIPESSMQPIMSQFLGMGYERHKFNSSLTSGHRSDIWSFRFLDTDFNSTSYCWNTTSPMTSSLFTLFTKWGVDDICQVSVFFRWAVSEKIMSNFFFPFNQIWLPYPVTYDIRVGNKIFSMGSPSYV